jgi:hypothetical protein
VILIVIAPALAVLLWLWGKLPKNSQRPGSSPLDRILEFFYLKTELAGSYALEQAFVRFFDRDYYGRFSITEALAAGLSKDRNRPQCQSADFEKQRRKLSEFASAGQHESPIYVVPVVANLKDCKLDYLPLETPIVDALMAANAFVPFFRTRKRRKGQRLHLAASR